MTESSLFRVGLFFDEFNKIRVLDPEATQSTIDLIKECDQFVENSSNFQQIVDNFIEIVDRVAEDVEHKKMKALGSRNLLKSIAKEREAEKQQLQAIIAEKRQKLERLKIQHQSLIRQETEQIDLIEQLTNKK